MTTNQINLMSLDEVINSMGLIPVVMYNTIIAAKSSPYETEEGCLFLDGVRRTTRYQQIEVEYLDAGWKKHHEKYSGWTA